MTTYFPPRSPAEGVPLPAKEVARDRVLDDKELAQVILAARKVGGPHGGIVELLALTGQRREEVAGLQRDELDLAQRVWTIPKARTKNAKAHIVHLSKQALAALKWADQREPLRSLMALGHRHEATAGTIDPGSVGRARRARHLPQR